MHTPVISTFKKVENCKTVLRTLATQEWEMPHKILIRTAGLRVDYLLNQHKNATQPAIFQAFPKMQLRCSTFWDVTQHQQAVCYWTACRSHSQSSKCLGHLGPLHSTISKTEDLLTYFINKFKLWHFLINFLLIHVLVNYVPSFFYCTAISIIFSNCPSTNLMPTEN